MRSESKDIAGAPGEMTPADQAGATDTPGESRAAAVAQTTGGAASDSPVPGGAPAPGGALAPGGAPVVVSPEAGSAAVEDSSCRPTLPGPAVAGASQGGAIAIAVSPQVVAPSRARRWGPVCVVAALGVAHGLVQRSAGLAVGAGLLGALAGTLFWHPRRFLYARTYGGTPWTVLVSMSVIGLMLFLQGVGGAIMAMARMGPLEGPAVIWLHCAAMAGTAGAVGMALLIMRLRGLSWWAIGLHRTDLLASLWSGVRTVLFMSGSTALAIKFYQSMGLWDVSTLGVTSWYYGEQPPAVVWVVILATVVAIPICEEILFRGMLMPAIRRRSGPAAAIVVSGLLFGAGHYPEMGPPTLLGLLLGGLYHITGNLWAPILAHMTFNGINMALAFDRAAPMAHVSWEALTLVLLAVAVLLLAPPLKRGQAPGEAPGPCPVCGREGREDGRCLHCTYPLVAGPIAASWALRGAGAAWLTLMALYSAAVSTVLAHGYIRVLGDPIAALQYQMLVTEGRGQEAQALVRQWAAARPDDPAVLHIAYDDAYHREAYAEAVAGIEPVLRRARAKSAGEETRLDVSERCNLENEMALALAELGGPRVTEAVTLARDALEICPEAERKAVEDTLGWALLRAGRLHDARRHLDKAVAGEIRQLRTGMAEVSYHRGVVLFALGELEQARVELRRAAEAGTAGRPFTGRARAILEHNALPSDLVPNHPLVPAEADLDP